MTWLRAFEELFLKINYFWLHRVFTAVQGLSLVAAIGGSSSLWSSGFPFLVKHGLSD